MTIPNRMILKSKHIKIINKYLNDHINYSKLTNSQKNTLITDILLLLDQNNIYLAPNRILTIRDTFIYLLSKTKGTIAHKYGEFIFTDFNNSISVIDISKKYKIPPMAVLNQILIELKYESHKIEKIIKKQSLPKEIYLHIQLTELINMDPQHWYNYNVPNIYDMLLNIKCSFTLKKNNKKNGKYPDVLFDNICDYKGQLFNWMVFKPYTLFDSTLHYRDIQKTLNNFNKLGTGIILYNDIICSKSFLKKIGVYVDLYSFLK